MKERTKERAAIGLMVVLALLIAVWAGMFVKDTWFGPFGPCTLRPNGACYSHRD